MYGASCFARVWVDGVGCVEVYEGSRGLRILTCEALDGGAGFSVEEELPTKCAGSRL